jgi:hypothetical protein
MFPTPLLDDFYQTLQRISPPKFSFLALLSVIRPLDVEIIEMPIPL